MYEATRADVDDLGWQRIGTRTSQYIGKRPYRAKQITDRRRTPFAWAIIIAFGICIVAASVAAAAPNLRGFLVLSRADQVYSRCEDSLESSLAATQAGIGDLTRRRVNGMLVCEALRDECRRTPYGERCQESINRL